MTPATADGVDSLLQQISRLVSQRQELRRAPAGQSELEANRLEIARCQRDLNRALIDIHRRDVSPSFFKVARVPQLVLQRSEAS